VQVPELNRFMFLLVLWATRADLTVLPGTNQRRKDMYKIGQKVNVRLADGKTRKATIMETAVPDLFHTHTPAGRENRQS